MTSVFKPLLDQSVGYGVVIGSRRVYSLKFSIDDITNSTGVGFFFAFVMLCLTFLQTRFTDTSPRASEEFTTASRNVKPGLVCCGIVSAWTWSATLLQSSTAAYTFGVSGPWWYGVGGTIQLAIFGMVAAKVKMNANGAHTFLEFLFRTYGTSPATDGMSGLYDLLVAAGRENPVIGNQDGSYLTMKSNQGLVFGAATILSGFSGIFCDQGYWQRAIASHPKSTTKAYMLGGLSWFAVPFAFASCLGLAARALQHDVNTPFFFLIQADSRTSKPRFPTFPDALSASQVSAGLAAPAAAAVVMGKGGAIAVLLVVFIYKAYLFPKARGPEIVRVSHMFICFWAVWMGCWATILHKANIDLGWLFYVQGVVLSPAVIPIALTVTWRKLTSAGILAGALTGATFGMLAWMIGCWKIYGAINIPNLAQPYSAVCSGLTGLLFSGIITVGVSLMNPADYDFKSTRAIANLDIDIEGSREDCNRLGDVDPNIVDGNGEKIMSGTKKARTVQTETPVNEGQVSQPSLSALKLAFKKAAWYSLTLTSIVAVIVPLPMFFSHLMKTCKLQYDEQNLGTFKRDILSLATRVGVQTGNSPNTSRVLESGSKEVMIPSFYQKII
ncbi:hypothetical protein CVT25_001492 [Psilocybe cyanescens]|uniref:Urea transporter n=1 Tax=Psilocybe cyanescens TaxID=93625 RepID=A0A409WNI1_PSICY|nr:hypothetical protein CVT25_001492 [Psilocybe cyanescens]